MGDGGGAIGAIGGGGGPCINPAPYEACVAYACMPENIEFWAMMDWEMYDDGKTIAPESTVSSYQKRVVPILPHEETT